MPVIDVQQCEVLELFEQPHLSIAEVAKLINFGPAIYNCPFFWRFTSRAHHRIALLFMRGYIKQVFEKHWNHVRIFRGFDCKMYLNKKMLPRELQVGSKFNPKFYLANPVLMQSSLHSRQSQQRAITHILCFLPVVQKFSLGTNVLGQPQ